MTTRNARAGAVLPATASPAAARCSVLGALTVVGDFWALAIIRCAFHGLTRFGAIQRELGIATNVLSDRLARLVEAGVLARVTSPGRRGHHEYALTGAGSDLAPVLLALQQWGDRHARDDAPWTAWRHAGCQQPARVEVRCTECGATPPLEEMEPVLLR